MRFRPGQSGNPKGKPKGATSHKTREIAAFARSIVESPEYVESLRRRLLKGDAPHMETLLHHYGYGKPKDTLAVESARPVVVELIGSLAPGGNGNWNGNGHQN